MSIHFGDIERAQVALARVNEKVAAALCLPSKTVRFVFLSYISSPKKSGQCLGLCVHESNEIQLLACEGWQRTAVHELVHLYRPDYTEERVKQETTRVCQYLKSFAHE